MTIVESVAVGEPPTVPTTAVVSAGPTPARLPESGAATATLLLTAAGFVAIGYRLGRWARFSPPAGCARGR